MAQLTLREGHGLGEPGLIRWFLKRDPALPEEGAQHRREVKHEEASEQTTWQGTVGGLQERGRPG